MRLFVIAFVFLSSVISRAQTDPNTLMGVPQLSTSERLAITAPITIGNIVYDKNINRLFQYTNTGWQELLMSGNIYPGMFTVTGAGLVQVTGLPFKPSSVTFVAHLNVETLDLDDDNSTGNDNDRSSNNSFGTMNGFARDTGGAIPDQQVIAVGGSGASINDISRFASSTNAIGARYANHNGDNLGVIEGQVTAFTSDGFTIQVVYKNGVENINNEDLVVLFTAYR